MKVRPDPTDVTYRCPVIRPVLIVVASNGEMPTKVAERVPPLNADERLGPSRMS